jgi:hypothetical protein
MKLKKPYIDKGTKRRVNHESQTIKEDPKRVARRLRAQKRREKKAAEDAAAKTSPPRLVKRNEKPEVRRKPPTIVSSGVPGFEEESFLTLTELNGMVSPNLSFVKFCQPHYQAMVTSLVGRHLTPWMSVDVPDLHEKLKKKEIEPLFHSFDWLIRLAVKAIGVEALKKYHCPVCAFKAHDYVDQVAEAMEQSVAARARENA